MVYNSTKLSSLLNNSKYVTAFEEKHVVYRSVCATADCNADYIGKCARRLNELKGSQWSRPKLPHG